MKNNDQKNNILKSAAECFARFGFEKTTLDDIGKKSGLNKASLYYYYKNKEEIFTEVILAESKDFIESLQKKVAQYPDADSKILNYLLERLRYYQKVLNLHQLSIQTLQKVEPLFDKTYKLVLEQEIQFIAQILNAKIDLPENRKIAEIIILVADAVKHKAIQDSNKEFAFEVDYSNIEQDIVFIIQLILKGLGK